MAKQTFRSMAASYRLEGKVAIITRGDEGIGRAIALRLAAEAADIAFFYRRNRGGAEEVVSTITGEAGAATTRRVLALQTDVSNTVEVQNLFTNVFERLGQLTSWLTTPVWNPAPTSWASPSKLTTSCSTLTSKACSSPRRRWCGTG